MLIARPLRAYALIGLLVLGWLLWRLPAMRADLAALQAVGRPSLHKVEVASLPSAMPPPSSPLVVEGDDPALPTLRLPPRPLPPPAPRLILDPGVLLDDGRVTARDEPIERPAWAAGPAALAPVVEASRAEQAYALLAAGDRRGAATAFRQAIEREAGDPRVPQWRAQLGYLERRWSGMAYVLARNSGKTAPTAVIPALTAAQSGAQLAYTLNPLSPRPFAVVGRMVTANDGIALNGRSAQAALALTWRPVPAVHVAAERLIRAGPKSRDAWTVRVAAGGEALRPPGRRAWNAWSAYGETGIVGTHRQDLYAASALRVGRGIGLSEKVSLTLGGGLWASVQHYDLTAHWVEVGPSAQLRLETKPPVNVALDYRLRINGNADPGTGPALTVSTGF